MSANWATISARLWARPSISIYVWSMAMVILAKSGLLSLVAIDCIHRERRQTHGEIFRAFFPWCAVAHPLALVRDHSLPGADIEYSVAVLDSQRSFHDDGEFIKLRGLPGFNPTARAAHMRDRSSVSCRVDAPHVFVDELGLVSSGFNSGWRRNERRHDSVRRISKWLTTNPIK